MPDKVIEDHDGWSFPLRGERITRVAVDHRVEIGMEGGVVLTIGGPFTLRRGAEVDDLDVRHPSSLAPVLTLLQTCVDHARASAGGLLRVAIATGYELLVQPSADVDAWQIVLPDGCAYLSPAGAEVTVLAPPRD